MDKVKTPLFKKLVSHYKSLPTSFHIPGHKMGKGFNPQGKGYYKDILKIDMTEITGLDDLHQPKSVILKAEQKAARIFKAEKTYFLVNGSTSGNLAMILATCNSGDKIIVQKNAHRSVINGILLARAIPIYLNPEPITKLGIAGGINEISLIKTLETNQNVKAVFITNPNYYGISMNIENIVDIVHRYKIPLLVDEAHGAHFGLHPSFPNSAIQMGADIVVQSTHKTLSAMTMGSMLHVNSKYIDLDRLQFFLSMVQTSSPSYPIMASLDLTCGWIEDKGEKLWSPILKYIDLFYQQATLLREIEVVHNLNKEYTTDPLKIVIHSSNNFLSGLQIQGYLEEKRIYTELADLFNTLAVVSLGTSHKDLKLLFKSLVKIERSIVNYENNQSEVLTYLQDIYSQYNYNEGQEGILLDKVLFYKNKIIPINAAIGEIAAEMVIPYPPGIPLIQIGERITYDYVKHIIRMKELGIKMYGLYGDNLDCLKIFYNSNTLSS
ncbi:MAG: aminotransferase class I/II-fold pyridoxal phosphate-dependent enzyme [Vulcanibacillus sp.]